MSGIERAAILDSSQHGKHFRGVDLGNGSPAQPGENISLKPLDDFVGVRVRPIWRMLGKPLARNDLETIAGPIGARRFHHLAVYARIDAVGNLLAQLVAAFARLFQAHVGIDAKG